MFYIKNKIKCFKKTNNYLIVTKMKNNKMKTKNKIQTIMRNLIVDLERRKKLKDENLNLQEALNLLNGVNKEIKGDIYYNAGFNHINLSKIALKDMEDFVVEKFDKSTNNSDCYFNIDHRVYSRKKDEEHYLDLARGNITGRFGAKVIKEAPFQIASIDFIVEKKNKYKSLEKSLK